MGFIDKTGRVAIEPLFDFVADFSEGYAAVRIGNKRGYIDKAGKPLAMDGDYLEAKRFSEGLAAVKTGDRWGFIDKTGRIAISARFDEAEDFSEGFAAVRTDKKEFCYIDKKGTVVLYAGRWLKDPQRISRIHSFSNGYALVEQQKPVGSWFHPATKDTPERFAQYEYGTFFTFMDKSGRNGADYDAAQPYSEGLAFVGIGRIVQGSRRRYCYIDTSRNTSIEGETIQYTAHMAIDAWTSRDSRFSGGLAAVSKSNRWGFIDQRGRLAIDATFEDVGDFSEGLATVKKDNHWGYIDTTGHMAIDPRFDRANAFSDGLALVKVGNREVYIDTRGRIAFDKPKVDNINTFSEGLAAITVGTGKPVFVGN